MLAQEEEVHGKQRELDALKEEEKKLLEEIKASEKEIQKLSHDLEVSSEINTEVCVILHLNHYFHLHVCVSTCRSSVTLQRYITLIAPVAPASQNVTNKSY